MPSSSPTDCGSVVSDGARHAVVKINEPLAWLTIVGDTSCGSVPRRGMDMHDSQ